MKYKIAVLLAALFCAGCETPGGGKMGLFSATAPVVAILHDDLFKGEAVGYLDRTGTIEMESILDSNLRCVGEFRYTGTGTGSAVVRCNDGAEAKISFNALTNLSGYGYGRTTRGPVSFTYGLTPEQASEYLRMPQGKTVVSSPGGPKYADI